MAKADKTQLKSKKAFQWKLLLWLLGIFVVIAAVSVAMIPLIRLLSSETGQQLIVERMQQFGIFAPLLFVFLQVLQVVIAVIPGGPVPIIGGVLFGEWGALALCLAGFFLGTVLVYYLVQWIGRPLVDKFVSEKHFQKFQFLMEGKRLEWLIFLVFLLPGLPKDVLTYLVSFNSKVKPMHLFLLTTLGRTPATILTVFLGGSLGNGNYVAAFILVAVLILCAVGGIMIKRHVDKRAEKQKKGKEEHGKSIIDNAGVSGEVCGSCETAGANPRSK